jgi:hypothetical protein
LSRFEDDALPNKKLLMRDPIAIATLSARTRPQAGCFTDARDLIWDLRRQIESTSTAATAPGRVRRINSDGDGEVYDPFALFHGKFKIYFGILLLTHCTRNKNRDRRSGRAAE